MIAAHVVTLALMLAAPEAPPGYSYAVAVLDAAPDATPAKLLAAWQKMMQERSLEPDHFDAASGIAIGNWMNRAHVCSGRVRYHAAIVAERTLKLFMVAECSGNNVALDRAVSGLADELAKRLGLRTGSRVAPVTDVPLRLWEVRSARGKTVPPDVTPAAETKPQ